MLCLDCDNTLWDGAVGELGPEGVGLSAPFLFVQEVAVQLQRQGVLLGVCWRPLLPDPGSPPLRWKCRKGPAQGRGRSSSPPPTTPEAGGAATIKGMAWPASPVATGCQGNPCATGIRWGVSPTAQMGCLRNRSGSPSGADQP